MTPAEEWAGRQYPGMEDRSEACCWTTCWGG